jgi:excisionase family DNA binding protein
MTPVQTRREPRRTSTSGERLNCAAAGENLALAGPAEPSRPPTTTGTDMVVAPEPVEPVGGDRRLLCTPAEAAQLLAVPESWLRRKAAARVIPCTFLGKHLRFSAADLAAITRAGAQPPSSRTRTTRPRTRSR